MKRHLRVLNVEDSKRDATLIQRYLEKGGYELQFERVDSREPMRSLLRSREWDVILADYSIPNFGALDAIALTRELGLDIPFIIISGTIGEDLAVQAMLAGAHDYLMKDNLARLVPAIEREIEEAMNRRARKHAEAAVRASEERYRLLFESIPLPSYVFDQETLHFLAVNEAMVRHYGYSRDALLNMTILDIRPEEASTLIRPLHDWAPSAFKGQWKHRKQDGTIIDVEISDHALIFEGRPAYLVLAHDVTDQKLLESQLRQAQKMEAVGQLAGGVAHDFNNLLTVITGYSQLAMSRIHDEDPLHQDLDQVIKAAMRAASLTRQLLAFSRKQVMLPVVLDLNSIIAELEKMLRRLIGEDILLKTVLSRDIGHVEADPGQIEQVIMNLAINARDAMPEGGRLTIETSNITLSEDYARRHIGIKAGPHVMLAVSDTGIGMDANTQARIFEPFFTTKEMGKGTGLGLSTVYGIVKQSGGSIWVYSEPGHGTTFKIYLPLCDKDSQDYKRGSEGELVLHGSETLLLVEDDEMVRSLTRQVLEHYGYHVLEASNGGAALLICEKLEQRIDLLITDVVMPEMSGKDLVTRLSQLRPDIKVLFMSGYTDAAIVHHGVLEQNTPFLQKPFAPEALVRSVRQLLDQASRNS